MHLNERVFFGFFNALGDIQFLSFTNFRLSFASIRQLLSPDVAEIPDSKPFLLWLLSQCQLHRQIFSCRF